MTLSLLKLSAGGFAVLVAALLHHFPGAHGASIRHHRLRGGDQGAYLSPSSDMIKALEYIESLKQRTDGAESPTGDYDEVDKFRLLVQLASLQDEDAPARGDNGASHAAAAPAAPAVAARWPDSKAPQWVRSLLRTLEQAESEHGPERRPHKTRRPITETDSVAGEYEGVVRPHKKYPLMFEDEENIRDHKRATEDLDEQYTPQSLANMRSIFEELGKLNRKREEEEEEGEEGGEEEGREDEGEGDDGYRVRNLAYEDVTGGEEWLPLEEQVETEEVVKGSHEEFERGLGEGSEENEQVERRAVPAYNDKGDDDDTKLVDYYLLKVLEMTDQAQKRDLMDPQSARRRLLNRPSLLDPRAIKQLLSAVSMKLKIPPEDLVGMLFMEETRKQQRLPEPQLGRKQSSAPRYKSRVIKYYNGRQPEITVSDVPADVKTEDILKILGMGKNSKYFLKPRPYLTSAASRYFSPSGRRGGFSASEINRALSKRKDDYDDTVDEDEVATFLAAKLLTEYPEPDRKRAADSAPNAAAFPYEVYEEAMKDYFDQIDTGKSPPTKRDTQGKEEGEAPQKPPTENTVPEQVDQPPESVTEGEKDHHNKLVSGM